MRKLAAIAVAIVWLGVWAGSVLGAERPVVLQAGGGALFPSTTDGPFLGRSYFVSVARPLRPWFLLGGEASWYKIDSSRDWSYWGVSEISAWNSVVVAATFRLQVPVRVGPAPFLVASSGAAWSNGGDTTFWSIGGPFASIYDGPDQTVWTSSVGLGVRAILPGDWPDIEVSARKTSWITTRISSLVEPRLSLSW